MNMSGVVQTPLSPVLQESKTTPNKQQKKPNMFHPKHQFKQKDFDKFSSENFKKRQKAHLPNKFLLGGNITDPLNLNGLLQESGKDIKTPKSSPLPKPSYRIDVVDVILRPNIKDPLNLEGTYDDNHRNLLINNDATRKPRKHRRSISRTEHENDNQPEIDIHNDTSSNTNNNHDSNNKLKDNDNLKPNNKDSVRFKRKRAHSLSINGTNYEKTNKINCTISDESLNRIDDDIEEQPGHQQAINITRSISCINTDFCTPAKRPSIVSSSASSSASDISLKQKPTTSSNSISNTNINVENKKYEKNGFKFRHGNYNRYYGYRNPDNETDHRLDHLKSEWFKDKNVLDIGCNVGHVTLHIAQNFQPKKIVGIDIDAQLIYAARKNIRNYMDKIENEKNNYPISCEIVYGNLMTQTSSFFPKNVYFIQGDYVPQNEDYLNQIKPEYDFILALSITKWIHLNNGDEGIKRFFKKIYLNLNINGCLLLEPQSWTSYKKKAKLTKETCENFSNIKFKPNEFTKYLLSKEIGFSTCRTIAMPHHQSKGFRRPILLFTKLESKTESMQVDIEKQETNEEKNEQQQQQQQEQSINKI